MRPFTEQIGPVKMGYDGPHPQITVRGKDPDGSASGAAALAVLDRDETGRLRDWLNEHLDDGGGS